MNSQNNVGWGSIPPNRIGKNGGVEPHSTWPIDLGNEEQVVSWIAEVTGKDEMTIRECLCREFEQPGANVADAFAKESLEPYKWSEELVRFYERTDAFLYELIMWNRNSIKRRMRSFIDKYIAQYEGTEKNVLCIGDGLGFDSFYFAQNGQKVTYYEVPGFSHRFASKLFSLGNADVKIVSDAKKIPFEYFDVVICLDVLEHINGVPVFLEQLVSYIRPGGILIVHAPFYMIHPINPTHLKINRKYSGRLDLYHDCGLKLINGRFFWNPLIFEKNSEKLQIHASQRSSLGMFSLKLGGIYLSLGRFTTLPFLWINSYKTSHNRWFDEKEE